MLFSEESGGFAEMIEDHFWWKQDNEAITALPLKPPDSFEKSSNFTSEQQSVYSTAASISESVCVVVRLQCCKVLVQIVTQ